MSRVDDARAWAALARERLGVRDALASRALDMARALYAAVPEHEIAKAKPEEIIAGALLAFARAHADTEREYTRAAVEAALRGAVGVAARAFAMAAEEITVDLEVAQPLHVKV